jgi:hypothetical protein
VLGYLASCMGAFLGFALRDPGARLLRCCPDPVAGVRRRVGRHHRSLARPFHRDARIVHGALRRDLRRTRLALSQQPYPAGSRREATALREAGHRPAAWHRRGSSRATPRPPAAARRPTRRLAAEPQLQRGQQWRQHDLRRDGVRSRRGVEMVGREQFGRVACSSWAGRSRVRAPPRATVCSRTGLPAARASPAASSAPGVWPGRSAPIPAASESPMRTSVSGSPCPSPYTPPWRHRAQPASARYSPAARVSSPAAGKTPGPMTGPLIYIVVRHKPSGSQAAASLPGRPDGRDAAGHAGPGRGAFTAGACAAPRIGAAL